MAEKTYFTKADLINFGEWLLSDERRRNKQRDARRHYENGTIGFKPWSVMERILTVEDFKEWKENHKNKQK